MGPPVPSPEPRDAPWPLAEPVLLPLDRLSRPWRPLAFDAWFHLPTPEGEEPRERLLKGVVMRLPPESDSRGGGALTALCRLCPHELCWVDLRDSVPELHREDLPSVDHPVFACPCHTSLFDPLRQGAVLAGPSPRGLYRFGIEKRQSVVAVVDLEATALTR